MADSFGFIGTGNMGSALAWAVSRGVGPENVVVADRTRAKAERLAKKLLCTAGDNDTVASGARSVFLCVKPQGMEALFTEIAPILAARRDRFVLVSIAAGVSLEKLAALSRGDYPIVRLMPNTPVSVGEGVVLYDCNERVAQAELDALTTALSPAGLVERIDEALIDAASCVSGCGPAFCDLFLEALADGAVACGLPRAVALRCAAQMVLGTAKLALETGEHPGALKDAVCSPGGSTIQGVRALEQGAFRAAVMEAVIAAYERTLEMG